MIPFLHTLADHPIISVFLFLNLAIGFWAHRKAKANSFEDYALASRSLPVGVLVMTLLGTLVARGELSFSYYSFKHGLIGLSVPMSHVLMIFLVGTFVAPHLVYFRGQLTQGDLMEIFYGRIAKIIVGLIGMFIGILIISSQIRTIAHVSRDLLEIDPYNVIKVFGVLIILYSIWGGMRAVSYTDVLQTITVLVVFMWIAHTMLQKTGGGSVFMKGLFSSPKRLRILGHPSFYEQIQAVIFWGLSGTFILSLPTFQRMLMTQNKRQVRKMWYTVGLFYGLICLLSGVIGFTAFMNKELFSLDDNFIADLSPRGFLFSLINNLFKGKQIVNTCIFIGFLAVLISTIDSYLHATGVSFVQDIIGPVRKFLQLEPLNAQQKTRYAKIGIALVGFGSVLTSQFSLDFLGRLQDVHKLYKIAVFASGLIIVPLLIGIVGVKTDIISWLNFSIVYLTAIGVFRYLGYSMYQYFLVSLPLATLAYFLTHIIKNRGIVTLKRSELTVSERLWLPSWSGCKRNIISWVKAPLHLPTLADRKVVNTPIHSLAFSMLVFALYTLSSIFSSGAGGAANFMVGVHFMGITLCAGLMLEGIWPGKLKPYFALYWFFTLFYCLPFGGTLTFFCMHDNVFDMILWIASFTVFAFLVDNNSFCVLSILAAALSVGIWRIYMGASPIEGYSDLVIGGIGSLSALILSVFLFGRGKESRMNERIYWNRIASSALGHDVRGSVQMLGGAGDILERMFEIGEPSTNVKGEKGYWLPFAQSKFLAQYSTEMNKKAANTRKEVANFLAFIKSQIMGTFEQKGVSIRTMAEEGMEKLKGRDKSSRTEITLEVEKDFEAKVLAGIFPNVISNLLMNAASHGKATEIKVKIDGDTRTITVWDNGKGIPADVLPHIFDLGYSTASPGKENAGVGLAFVKMVLDTSAAKISCHSRVGKNAFTEFVMTFA